MLRTPAPLRSRPALTRIAFVLAVCVCPVLAPAAASAQTLAHQYFLAGNLADALGGPALTADGGSLSANGYTFGANQGLTTQFTQLSPYSIVLRFSFDAVTGYRKVVDYKGLSADAGAYVLDGADNFYPRANGAPGAFTAGTLEQFVLTRNAAGIVAGYVNGVQQYSYDDSSLLDAIFTGNANLFIDDNATGQREASSGFVNYVAFYNGALSAGQVAGLTFPSPTSTVPEPATLAFVAAGVAAIGVARRRRSA